MKRYGTTKRHCRIELDPREVDFTRSYSFRFEDEGKIYLWTGAKPQLEGDRAVFDWASGANGVLTGGSPQAMAALGLA